MTANTATHSLQLVREMNVPAEKLYKAWTTPERMGEWFCPKPWKVTDARSDVRPGGESYILMEGPNGEKIPNYGVYLEVVPNRKLVFTDAYTAGWVPSEKPFMTAIVEFEDLGNGRTKYTATALHWTEEDKKAHEDMGFHEGWGIVAGQLEEVAKTF
ncbi:SRPBCC family protein [Neorhizobium sp. CSC1952]|uniref:SRPBCC family protein n=1 Tax=Neorhizobium sp. CSC1952 TaxID=2978974 RepID=UPI0025A50F77|nr:SRPBCC family protein [Rhizobium sp. CSC1952]WJR65915.1 SRPBCC family protein [Rhizobium sp. CSC1952]